MTDLRDSIEIELTVNGREVKSLVDVRMTAADFLRDVLRLRGTRVGCEHGVCGACTVLIDGVSARSCILFAPQLDGTSVKTVEGLEPGPGELHPIQKSFRKCHGLQCGFCTAGILLVTYEYLQENCDPSEQSIREALSGNICRCTGYQGIVDSVQEADRTWDR